MKQIVCLALMATLGIATAVPQTKGSEDYNFGFDAGSHFRKEEKTPEGKTLGEYGFRTPDGCMHVVKYEADQQGGYRVLGSSKRDCNIKAHNRRPFTTTTTTKRPTTTTTKATTTARPTTTTTRRPTTTTTTTPRTTTRTTTTTTTTTTTPKPRNPLSISPVPQVNNAIEAEEPQGRQLSQPGTAEKEPEPLYSYGYKTDTHGHTESGLPDGSKKGEYYWDSPDGWRIIVTYEANERGFYPRVKRIRLTPTTPRPEDGPGNGNPLAKELGPDKAEEIAVPVGGCPYYFYYNTRMNYHWEHCHENSNRTGEFGHLGSDGYSHKTSYYADSTGFHPRVSRTPLTARQAEVVAEYTKGAFIIPKPDEERTDTERRIQEWLRENRDRVDNPLR
ncbi:uncharacterized protein LOC135221039 [Macrobrachium nipponense]|uniref:uncharacterized protein LOC135221039 n=1 Tax=Macrobrachium nipponense TaxID=159736 RepID=UPI0030C7A994